jgi:ATP-dependent Clp protease ATP-binding subunit ClpB
LSERYISDRFLPDKAIDLMDEAAAKLRMERDSVPEELDEITRHSSRLRLSVRPSNVRTIGQDQTTRQGDCRVQGEGASFRAKWEAEKGLVNKIQQDKQQIENLKFEADKAEREGDYGRVAEIRYGKLKELRTTSSQHPEAAQAMQGGSRPWCARRSLPTTSPRW